MNGFSTRMILRCCAALLLVDLGPDCASAFVHAGAYGVEAGSRGSWGAVGYGGGSVAVHDGTVRATNGYGTTVVHGADGTYYGGVYSTYHPPAVVGYYGTGCADCGGWSGAAAAAVAVPAAAPVEVAAPYGGEGGTYDSAAENAGASDDGAGDGKTDAQAHAGVLVTGPNPDAASTPPPPGSNGAIVAALPAGCIMETAGNEGTYYECRGTWYKPYYGANGVYYRVVPAP
jgi:hypothetical protein